LVGIVCRFLKLKSGMAQSKSIEILVVTGRPEGQKDPVHSTARKLETTLRKHLCPKSKRTITHLRSIALFESLNVELAAALKGDITCFVFVGARSEETNTFSLLMEADEADEEVDLPKFILSAKSQAKENSLIICLVHFTGSIGQPRLTKEQATSLADQIFSAGAITAVVGYQQSLFSDDIPAEIVLDQCLQKECTAVRTGFIIKGEWLSDKDKKAWRPVSPVKEHVDNDDADAFRASTMHDEVVTVVATSEKKQVHDREQSLDVMFRAMGSTPIGPTPGAESLSPTQRAAVVAALKDFPLALQLFQFEVVTVKSVQVVLAEKPPPRLLQPNEYWCSACESVVSGKPNWDKHVISNPHQKRVDQGVIATYTCVACNADICGEINLNQHLLGAKHKRKADFHRFTCPICKDAFDSQSAFVTHRKSPCTYK
jgi:hypothetical protein